MEILTWSVLDRWERFKNGSVIQDKVFLVRSSYLLIILKITCSQAGVGAIQIMITCIT